MNDVGRKTKPDVCEISLASAVVALGAPSIPIARETCDSRLPILLDTLISAVGLRSTSYYE